ncbi:hypothetical protein BRADI_4g09843v3 [Brachypodium distachyon]|uniref:Knottin scorpion toxin-like domain-containing protein n=1 Tax=Brachypodium distachyon TaxID=15368 RepID=A0A2K2CLN4_BRADI|nr:hypothetical protein BRADI_4g09843v3 [Brachypodium distachyon]
MALSKRNATIVYLVALMVVMATVQQSCDAAAVVDGVKAAACSPLPNCEQRCGTVCSVSGNPSSGAHCQNGQCYCA